LQMKKLRLMEN